MKQELVQTQEQKQQLVQRLSAQQMLNIRLLEMPLTELEESINAELDDNPALEVKSDADDTFQELSDSTDDNEDFDQRSEREEREDALDSALENLGRDDEMPEYSSATSRHDNAEYEEIVFGDTVSFYDKLKEQIGEHELSDEQRTIIEYLIGSLEDDGLLRKDLDTIADELAIYQNIDSPVEEIEKALHILQEFDPPGIGARSLQECLLIQIRRKKASHSPNSVWDIIEKIITNHFDAFTKKHWDKIQTSMRLSDIQLEEVQTEIRKLNPKPGAALGETLGRNIQQITPDFIVESDDNGLISFHINQADLPDLYVSPSFEDMINIYRQKKGKISLKEKEALLYAKEKVEKAQNYIEAIRQRRQTLYVTMKAIINHQRKFFLDGDESELKPMILKDIANVTGLDISTISRVSNVKYVQTRWGVFPLRFFFSEGYTTKEGEELSVRKVKIVLKEIIAKEDKKKPMSDEELTKKMKEHGYPIARRTVAKYREQMGIPVARLRKE